MVDLRRWVCHQATLSNRSPTPFISISSDLLRAFNWASHLRLKGEDDVCIVVIDAWILGSANTVDCNSLRALVDCSKEYLFETEVLVYRRIPSNAIIARWSWDQIVASLGPIYPPLVDLCLFPHSQTTSVRYKYSETA